MKRWHIAIVTPAIGAALLSGAKRTESRFTRTRRAPFGRVAPGERILFKASGGPVLGWSQAVAVKEFADLAPGAVDDLRRRYEARIAAPASYWERIGAARFAVLIDLAPLRRVRGRVHIPRQYGAGWIVMPEIPAADLLANTAGQLY